MGARENPRYTSLGFHPMRWPPEPRRRGANWRDLHPLWQRRMKRCQQMRRRDRASRRQQGTLAGNHAARFCVPRGRIPATTTLPPHTWTSTGPPQPKGERPPAIRRSRCSKKQRLLVWFQEEKLWRGNVIQFATTMNISCVVPESSWVTYRPRPRRCFDATPQGQTLTTRRETTLPGQRKASFRLGLSR